MLAYRTFLLLYFLLLNGFITAQQSRDRIIADSLFSKAGNYEEAAQLYQKIAKDWEQEGRLDSAFRNYLFQAKSLSQLSQWEDALSICDLLTRPKWIAFSGAKIGDLYFEKGFIEASIGKHLQAIKSYDQALTDEQGKTNPNSLKIANIEQYKGVALMYDGKPAEAERLILNAHETRLKLWPNDTLPLAYSANNLYLLYDELYESEKAGKYATEALRILKKNLPTTHPHIAFILNNYSLTRSRLGDPIGARDILLEAVKYNKEADRAYNLANNYFNLGNLFTDMNELELATTYFTKSYEIADSVYANPGQNRANLYDGLGRLAWYKGQYETADSLFTLALTQKRNLGDNQSVEIARSYHNRGLIAIDQERWQDAIRFLRQSIKLRTQKLGTQHPLTLESQYRMARCIWEEKKDKEALVIWKKCLKTFKQRQGSDYQGVTLMAYWLAESYQYFGETDSVDYYLKYAWMSILGKEDILRNWSELKDHSIQVINPTVFEIIHFHLQYLVKGNSKNAKEKRMITRSIIVNLNKYLPNILPLLSFQHTRHTLTQILQEIYGSAVLIMHREKEDANPEWQQFLLACIENSKAFTTRIALQNRSAMQFANIPDSLVEKDRNLRAQIWTINSLKNTQYGTTRPALLKRDLNIKNEWITWQKRLSDQYPDYYQLLYKKKELDFGKVSQDLIKAKETMLAYVFLDSVLIAITFNGQEILTNEWKLGDSLSEKINEFNDLIGQRGDITKITEIGYALYQQLFQPVEKNLGKRVLLFPDGPLHFLNFDLLVSNHEANSLETEWLINQFDIRYANRFDYHNEKNQNGKYNLALAPGFSTTLKQNYLNQLTEKDAADSVFLSWLSTPWSIELVEQLAQQNWGKVLIGNQATQKHFLDLSGQANILHFATHARVNNEKSLQSFLVLNPDPSVKDDGYLYAYELYGLSMNHSLIVLSACQSGLGAYQRGEGILSLAHAFQYAGSPSMIFSLWSIDDQQTNVLIQDFYQGINEGKDISAALRDAKISYQKSFTGDLNHPFYWGSLVFMGQNKIISQSFLQKNYWIYLLGFLAVMGIFYYYFQKKSK